MITNKLKRCLSGLLAALMVLTLLPTTAWAATTVASGTCGDNLTWTLDSAGKLTISGTGKMENYYSDDAVPWYSNRGSVKTAVIQKGATSIGYGAFRQCSSLSSISIPSSVTSIGSCAFEDCTSLSSVSIPSSVTSIGSFAFEDCTSLSSVSIPNSVTDIGSSAFYGCTSLSSVSIPNSVTDIGGSAFYGCTSLTSISIPSSVTRIGDYAFRGCTGLTAIQVASGNSNYSSSSGVLFNKAKTELICCPAGRSGSYTIPGSVTSIGGSAFYGCTGLTSVSIPSSVTSIGDDAFHGCTGLSSISIPNSVTSIGGDAFEYCDNLSSISIGNSVTSIGGFAFYYTAYYNDESNWTNGLLYLGVYLLDARGDIATASIRSGTKLIADYAFAWCYSLTGVTLPSSMTGIGESAFCKCSSLTSVTIPNSVTGIGVGAFKYCDSLSSISIGSSVTRMGENAFYNTAYYNNESNWTNGILYLGAYVLDAKEDITKASIRSGTKLIANWAFNKCKSLTSITIPGSVTSIGNFALYGCTRLTSVSIPTSVATIGEGAFSACWNLADVYYAGSKTQWNKITIGGDNKYLLSTTIHFAKSDTPVAPKISASIVSSTGRIKLTWSAAENAAKYYIYRSTDGGSTYKYYDSTTKTSYTNTSVTPGKNYYYKVKSVNSSGTKSAYSNAVSRVADCARPVVKISNVASSGAIKLTWDSVTGASKYEIYRATSKNGTYSYYTSTTSTSWTNKSVTPGKTYYYKVKAICGKSSYGNSAYSAVVSRTADCAKPVVTIQLNGGKPQLKWKAITGAEEYVIYRATSKSGTYTKMYTTTKLSYTNTGAKSGTTYYYKVKAICGRSSYGNSAYSSVVSIKSK